MNSKCNHLTEFGIQKIVNDKSLTDIVLQIIEYENEKKHIGNDTLSCSFISDGNAKLRCYFQNKLQTKTRASKGTEGFNVHKTNNQIIALKNYGATSKSVLIYQYDVLVEEYEQVVGAPIIYKDFLTESDPKPMNVLRPDRVANRLLASTKKPNIEASAQLSIPKKHKIQIHDASEFDNISDLYPDMHSWRIYCRITKLNYSEFKSKQNKDVKLLNLELTDRRGSTISATLFGNYGEKMSKTLEVGETYIFSKGLVKVDNYKKGSTSASQYVLSFTDSSKIDPTTDDQSIITSGASVIPLSDIKQKEANTQVDIIGIIKEIRNPTQIQSKANNKTHKKQIIVICDPVSKIQIDATLWNLEKDIDMNLLNKTVLLNNFKINQYNNTINLTSSFKSTVTPVNQHDFRDFESRIDSMQFQPMSYRRDQNNSKVISNIRQMEAAKENMAENDAVWSDLRVYLNRIKDKPKKIYDGCPNCKKGVQPEDTSCSGCNKNFDKPTSRYIVPIEISDYTGSIWTTAYDEFAVKMFKVAGGTIQDKVDYPASEVKTFDEKKFEQLSKQCLFQEFKIKVVTKYEDSYDGQKRTKNTITKTFPINFLIEAKNNLDYIRKRL